MVTPTRRSRRPLARRRYPRWPVAGARLVGPVLAGRVLDLGPAGAGIETASGLRVGSPYAVTLELSGSSRRLRARVRWCRLVATRRRRSGECEPVYRAGLSWSPSHLARPAKAPPEAG